MSSQEQEAVGGALTPSSGQKRGGFVMPTLFRVFFRRDMDATTERLFRVAAWQAVLCSRYDRLQES
jgi:hypothetical protein